MILKRPWAVDGDGEVRPLALHALVIPEGAGLVNPVFL